MFQVNVTLFDMSYLNKENEYLIAFKINEGGCL